MDPLLVPIKPSFCAVAWFTYDTYPLVGSADCKTISRKDWMVASVAHREEIEHIEKGRWLIVILEHIGLCKDERRQANRDQESRGTHIV
jgi:hypothetical protein